MSKVDLSHHLERLVLKKTDYWDIWGELDCSQRKKIRRTLNYQGTVLAITNIRVFRHLVRDWKIEKTVKTIAEFLEH